MKVVKVSNDAEMINAERQANGRSALLISAYEPDSVMVADASCWAYVIVKCGNAFIISAKEVYVEGDSSVTCVDCDTVYVSGRATAEINGGTFVRAKDRCTIYASGKCNISAHDCCNIYLGGDCVVSVYGANTIMASGNSAAVLHSTASIRHPLLSRDGNSIIWAYGITADKNIIHCPNMIAKTQEEYLQIINNRATPKEAERYIETVKLHVLAISSPKMNDEY